MNPILTKNEFYLVLDNIKSNNVANIKSSINMMMTKSAKTGKMLYSTAPSVKEIAIELLEKVFNDESGILRHVIFEMEKSINTSDFINVSDELYDRVSR